ncbi:MAG: bifunctional protein HldE [Candidatus Hydrogenedentota bacterium]
MDAAQFRGFVEQFKKARVLVVGDIYLDEYVDGVMTGISLEAPIPIYEVHQRRYNPGAAGNAACNVASLGAKTYMIGYVGDDVNAGIVKHEFHVRHVDTSHIVTNPGRATNTYGKLRAGGHNIPAQEILRTDTPSPVFVSGAVEDEIIANIHTLAAQVDAIVVVDQVSSVCTERVLSEIVAAAKKHKLLTVGDSRARAGKLKGFDIVVPNDREAGIGTGISVKDDASLQQAGKALLEVAACAMVTCGEKGISIFTKDAPLDVVAATVAPRDVRDVTGAGDTATAAITLTRLAGGTLREAALVANYAAGVAVQKPGVVTVSAEELLTAFERKDRPTKVQTLEQVKTAVDRLRKEGKKIVWTNGCFDILHVGHITYLQRAAELGDVLIVGMNSDVSVRSIKGEGRPIIPEDERAFVLAALDCVSIVTVFGDPTPMEYLKALQPDFYAKGGDYTLDTVVQEERRLVEGYGGKIAIIPGVEGKSTTSIIGRISER